MFRTLFVLLPILVFLQGLLMSAVVLSRSRYTGNRYLGAFMLLIALSGLMMQARYIPDSPYLMDVYVLLSFLPFCFGPLVYFYLWFAIFRDLKPRWSFLFHSIPAALNFLFYLLLFINLGPLEFHVIVEKALSGNPPWYANLIEIAKLLHGILYITFIVRLIHSQRENLRRLVAERQHRRWIVAMLLVYSINWLFGIAALLLMNEFLYLEAVSLTFMALQLFALLAFIYTTAFFALRYPVILEPKRIREEIQKKLGLSEYFINESIRRLEKAEQHKFFLDSEVTLDSFAAELGLHPNALSFICNEFKQRRFREYLNSLRVAEFLRRQSGDSVAQSQLQLALDCGFNSKSTFLRAFRSECNCSPGEYLNRKTQ